MNLNCIHAFVGGALGLVLIQPGLAQPLELGPIGDVSFRHEVEHAITTGLSWLMAHQDEEGWWSSPDVPALTALVLTAIQSEPTKKHRTKHSEAIQKAYDYLLKCRQEDGSIHRGSLVNYNTALSVVALSLALDPAYDDVVRAARRFLIRSQIDMGEPGKLDSPFDGGVGYGSSGEHSDMSNTLVALEALRASEYLPSDRGGNPEPSLNWNAAIQFLQNCQNLPSVNKQTWVSDRAEDRGGFVYQPGESKAGGVTNAATGRVSLRSYGSISYVGLMSYLYARLEREDARVLAVREWLRENYTLEENPGMGQEGLYYYFHIMAKALTAAQVDRIALKTGSEVNWQRELAMRLINLQSTDGSWSNPNNRWWEKNPHLSTAYAVLTWGLLWSQL